jgi:hypothetical protein
MKDSKNNIDLSITEKIVLNIQREVKEIHKSITKIRKKNEAVN